MLQIFLWPALWQTSSKLSVDPQAVLHCHKCPLNLDGDEGGGVADEDVASSKVAMKLCPFFYNFIYELN